MSAENSLLLSETDQLQLAVHLYKDGQFGIKENPADYITLESERLSPHYLDIRPGISSYRNRQLIAMKMLLLTSLRVDMQGPFELGHKTLAESYDHFAGTPEAMTSYAATIADQSKMSLLQPRVATDKKTGNKTPILGRFKTGDKVAAFDDVITDGQSKIETIGAFAASGLVMIDYFVVLDREEGGAPLVLQETGIEVTPALGLANMVKILRAESIISTTQVDNVAEYLEQYGDPHARSTIRSVQ